MTADNDSTLLRHIRTPPKPPTYVTTLSKMIGPVISIAQIAIGAVYLHDCPIQRYIPIYLIVVGVFSLMIPMITCQEPKDGSSNSLNVICTTWNSIVSLFLFCWFITGNVWIYSIYQPNYNQTTTEYDSYCNKTLYLFAFWTTTLVYILLCLFLFMGCCSLVCYFICGRADADDDV